MIGKIRLAKSSDAGAIEKIYRPYVEETAISFEYEAPTKSIFEKRIEKTMAVYPYLVYAEGEKIQGYAYASRVRDREAYDWAAELSVYVDRNAQSQGIGQKLYKKLIDFLAYQGLQTVYGCVTYPNEKSEKLHKALGFQTAGIWHRSGFKQGAWQDVIWFEKIIGKEGNPDPIVPFAAIAPEIIATILSDKPTDGRNHLK